MAVREHGLNPRTGPSSRSSVPFCPSQIVISIKLPETVMILRSLAAVCLTLPDQTVVLPGHGAQTTIGHERATNPYLADLVPARAGEGRPGPDGPPARTSAEPGAALFRGEIQSGLPVSR